MNTFGGGLSIGGGVVGVSSDANLGAAPGVAQPGSIVIDGGALRATAGFELNSNRGILLGPPTGSGGGTLIVNVGQTLRYGGVMANNGGGVGGLTKLDLSELILSGANTYSGPTAIKNGIVRLDFTQEGSPVNNVINPMSQLLLSGATASIGTTNFAAVIVDGKASATNLQTFNGTVFEVGQSQVRANSGTDGSAGIVLGSLTHNLGGVAVFIPPTMTGGTGSITTTATNHNGILGGWAFVSDGTVGASIPPAVATNLARVDVDGSIVPYTAYTPYVSGDVGDIMFATNNILIGSDVPGDSLQVGPDRDVGLGVVYDVNTITANKTTANWRLNIGANNTLRLGRTGALFGQHRASPTWGITSVPGGTGNLNAQGNQDVGTLTAGGPTDNTPGEIIVYASQTGSGSANNVVIDARITDNGTGPVTVVKAGPGFLKLRGHNTHSGGTYLLQGRLQLSGSEVGTANPDGIGTGPLYIFPGGYLFFAGTGSAVTNEIFVAGDAARQEQGIGAIRTSGSYPVTGPVTLIGDATIGGNGGFGGRIAGKITGPYTLTLGPAGTVNGSVSVGNSENDWTGDTVMQARVFQNSGANTFISGGSEVIPNGFGKGNVLMRAGSPGGTITWNMNGFSETINGLSHTGTGTNAMVQNNSSDAVSMLTVGDNDQSGVFGGIIQDGTGAGVALTKIGQGLLTLTGPGTYTGPTAVNGGTLALSGTGTMAGTASITIQTGGTLDVSGATAPFTPAGPVTMDGGALTVRNTGAPGIGSLTMGNSRVRVTTLGVAPNVEVTTLTTAGPTNFIDVISVGTVTSYPAQFTIIKYTGSIGGAGYNFGLGTVPTAATTGFVSNNVANSSIDLVLLDGPKPLTWTGASAGGAWDIATTMNWLAFGTTPSVYLDLDSALFTDSSSVGTVNLTTQLEPGAVLVNNSSTAYTFAGPGAILGLGSLTKQGTGTLIIANEGQNAYTGGTIISAGTLQLGNGGTVGSIPGAVQVDGTLTINRSDDFSFVNSVSGSGTVNKAGNNIVTANGAINLDGNFVVQNGVLRAGPTGTFGGTGETVVSSGSTLDINGRSLSGRAVRVAGTGAGGAGAIINTGADSQNALGLVTLTGNTTFGGTGRWDIRGGQAALLTGGSAFSVTKVGSNQVSLVTASVDGALGNINIQEGIFSIEQGTFMNTSDAINVSAGATLQLWSNAPEFSMALGKATVLNGGATPATLNNASGANSVYAPVTLNGSTVVGAAGTSELQTQGTLSGSGSLTKTGTGTLLFQGTQTYTGATVVSNGTLSVWTAKSGGTGVTVDGGTLSGFGPVAEPVTITSGGRLFAGATGNYALMTLQSTLSLGGTAVFEVLKFAEGAQGYIASQVGGITTLTYGGTLQLNIDPGVPFVAGDSIKLFTFTSASGSFSAIIPASPGEGLSWDTSQLTVDGTLRVQAGVPVTEVEIGEIDRVGDDVVISGSAGASSSGAAFQVVASDDVTLPLAQWTVVGQGTFGTNGSFSVTIPINAQNPQRFYAIRAN